MKFPVLTVFIWPLFKGMPIITLFLQARDANMALALEQRTIWPSDLSRSSPMSSSKSTWVCVSWGLHEEKWSH